MLLEFSRQRQLAPPVDMITNSEETLGRKRPRDPLEAKKFDEEWKSRMGQIMPKKFRARALMDQKATSVADVSAVLGLLKEQTEKAEEKEQDGSEGAEEEEGKKLSHKARKRQSRALKIERARDELAEKRIEDIRKKLESNKVAVQIMDETLETADYGVSDGEVKIFWNDLHDAQQAESWPETVVHGHFKPSEDRHVLRKDGLLYNIEPPRSHLPSSPPEATESEADPKGESVSENSAEVVTEEEAETKKGLGKLKFWK